MSSLKHTDLHTDCNVLKLMESLFWPFWERRIRPLVRSLMISGHCAPKERTHTVSYYHNLSALSALLSMPEPISKLPRVLRDVINLDQKSPSVVAFMDKTDATILLSFREKIGESRLP